MISVEEAWRLIEQNRLDRKTKKKALDTALNYVLATPIVSKIDQPRANLSAMDGYAVRLEDVSKVGSKLTVVDKVPAGTVPPKTVNRGEAIRVFTGSIIPAGADHIVIQEDVEIQGSTILVMKGYSQSRHLRKRGLDFSEGTEIVKEGRKLGPMELLAIASSNYGEVEVYSKPKVAILTNGDELRPPGSKLNEGEIPNSNAIGLQALVELWGAEVIYNEIARDNLESIRSHIEKIGKKCDVIVPVGGASVGEYDLMKKAFAHNSYEKIFNKVAVKPGKPTWFFRSEEQRVLGLPGNPASAIVTAILFLKPLITGKRHKFLPAVSLSEINANGERECFLRARSENLNIPRSGILKVIADSNQDSALITPLVSGNCLIRRGSNALGIKAKDHLQVLPLE